MPLYEYECSACGHRFERIRKFSDPPVDVCPNCSEPRVQKLLSSPAIQFKGTGWYITDYARSKESKESKETKESNESNESKESKESKESGKSGESKESKETGTKKTASDAGAPASPSSTPGTPSTPKASGE